MVTLSGSLDAVLEKVCRELGTLLLVAVGIGSELVGISLGNRLELCAGGGALRGQRNIRMAAVRGLLAGGTRRSRALSLCGSSRGIWGLSSGAA